MLLFEIAIAHGMNVAVKNVDTTEVMVVRTSMERSFLIW